MTKTKGGLSASTERLAWSQTTKQGMGGGIDAYKHKRLTRPGQVILNHYERNNNENRKSLK